MKKSGASWLPWSYQSTSKDSLLFVKIKQPEIKFIPVFLSVGSTTSSTALQNEGELGDDDVFTVSTLFCINNYDGHNFWLTAGSITKFQFVVDTVDWMCGCMRKDFVTKYS